jgi:hypothetical protein
LTTTQERIAALEEYDAAILKCLIDNADQALLQSYSYGDSDGNQSKHNRSPKELWALHQEVQKEIEEVQQKSAGGGIGVHTMNRYGRGL